MTTNLIMWYYKSYKVDRLDVKMALFDNLKSRLLIVCGHYGSGKTNIAVNLALKCADHAQGKPVCVVDMDTVNPYFRSADSKNLLSDKGIRLIASEFANSNVDIPTLPAEVYSVFPILECGGYVVLDVGGDAVGSAALGFIGDRIRETGYEMLFVCNKYRPLTETPEDCMEIMDEIEKASGLKCTYLINNSNTGHETTADDINNSIEYQKAIQALSGLDTAFISAQIPYSSDEFEVLSMQNVTKRIF